MFWPFKDNSRDTEKSLSQIRKWEHERLLKESDGKTIRVVPIDCAIGFKVQWLHDGGWRTIKEVKTHKEALIVVDEIKEIENQRTMKPEYF